MHIAVINGFPRQASTAEVEFIRRFSEAAKRCGHQAYEVVTSDDIHDCQPDFVLATHEFTAKLTPFFTVGALWTPPSFFVADPHRVRSIMSYDGYLVGSAACHRFLDDLEFSNSPHKPRSDFEFLPTALSTEFKCTPVEAPLTLSYIGVHWDGARHGPLLKELAHRNILNVYGPPGGWSSYPDQYRGSIPFDGQSLEATLATHGIALCIHKEEHRREDTPSMRIFEAAAAGCLLIVDEIPFAKRLFGDSAFYIDLRNDAISNAREINRIVDWANLNRDAADAMRRQSHQLFNQQYALEKVVGKACEFVKQAKDQRSRDEHAASKVHAVGAVRDGTPDAALVDVVMRTGGRNLDLVRRAIASLNAQTVGTYRVILVDYKGRPDVSDLASELSTARVQIECIRCEDTGARSTSLWAGLRQVRAPFFANLDDDDTVAPDHFAGLFEEARKHPDHDLYYAGTVRVEEGAGEYIHAPNFAGTMHVEIKERRELVFLEPFRLSRLAAFDNFITSNAFIARTSALDERALVDPHLVVGEDMYLLLMLARRRAFRSNNRPSSYWHWRSASLDNSMLGVQRDVWHSEGTRIIHRLEQEVFCGGLTFGSLRKMAGRGEEGGWQLPTSSKRLELGLEHKLSDEYLTSARQRNLNDAQPDGVWTASTDATVSLALSGPVTNTKVRISFMVAGRAGTRRVVNLTINGENFFAGVVRFGDLKVAEREVHLPEATSLAIRVRCDAVFNPRRERAGDDGRNLGVFLSSIQVGHSSSTQETESSE